MKNALFALFVLVFSAATAFTQTCPNVAQNIVVRGFNLGMTEAEAKKRYPKIEFQKDLDVSGMTHWRSTSAGSTDDIFTESERENLESIELTFLDKRLAQINVVYNGFTEWKSLAEFTNASAKALKLPLAGYWVEASKNYSQRLQCKDFYVVSRLDPARSNYELQEPSLFFALNDFEKKLDERKKTQSEDQKKQFKP